MFMSCILNSLLKTKHINSMQLCLAACMNKETMMLNMRNVRPRMAEDRALCQYFDSELDIKQENFTAHHSMF